MTRSEWSEAVEFLAFGLVVFVLMGLAVWSDSQRRAEVREKWQQQQVEDRRDAIKAKLAAGE